MSKRNRGDAKNVVEPNSHDANDSNSGSDQKEGDVDAVNNSNSNDHDDHVSPSNPGQGMANSDDGIKQSLTKDKSSYSKDELETLRRSDPARFFKVIMGIKD